MTTNRIRRLARDERVLVALGALSFALIFCHPILGQLAYPGAMSDWDMLMGIKWAAWKSIVTYHQLPLWNPYRCGGLPLLGNPQSQVLSPFFPLSLIFGVFLGTHLQIILSLAIAWSGGYFLARTIGIGRIGAVAAAMVFPASSWFYLKVGIGHIYALEATYLPWAYATAWIAAKNRAWRFAAASGGILALTFLGSGPDGLVYGVVGLGAVMLAIAILDWTWQPLIVLGGVGLFTIGFAAIKAVPVFILMMSHPRVTGETEFNDLALLLTALFSRDQNLFRGLSNGRGFWEAGAYIGFFAIPALIGFIRFPRAVPWIFGAAILFMLTRGDSEPFSLWPALHAMPLFDSVRLPTRFLIPFTLMVGMLTGFGIDWLANQRWPIGAIVGAAIILVATVDCLLVGPHSLGGVIQYPANPGPPKQVFRQMHEGPNNSMLLGVMENSGALACYDYVTWSTNASAADRPGYRGEEYLVGPPLGALALVRWTPNALTYQVAAPAATEIVVNQNYDRWWRVVEGTGTVVDQGGLIGIKIPQGVQQIEIAYRDYGALIGALITLATCGIAIMLWRRESR